MRTKIMFTQRGGHGANNRQLLNEPCRSWKQVTDVDPGNRCLDGLKWASHFLWSIGFRIECLDVTWAPVEPEQDAATSLAGRSSSGQLGW